jgi:DNA polymerase III epsilon subunit-like protein
VTAECERGCGTLVDLAKVGTSSVVPVEHESAGAADGTLAVRRDPSGQLVARWLTGRQKPEHGERRGRAHWLTCRYKDGQSKAGDRVAAAEWARGVLDDPAAVVLDTETTGLAGWVVEISAIAQDGSAGIDWLVNPRVPIEAGASAIHGITDADVADKPRLADMWADLAGFLANRRVIVYNAPFDAGMLDKEADRANQPRFDTGSWECAMRWYAQWRGEWDDYHDHYKWHKLEGGHRAKGDCEATISLIKEMAAG